MDKVLINLPVGKLLEKFGGGSHKPGSGSAAALQGMLSAQLIRTVISLTNDPKRHTIYKEYLAGFRKINLEIESRIYPALEKLFQKDSVLFDKVINLRQAREEEENLERKQQLADQALQTLTLATDLPIEIAELCLELAEFSLSIFDNGFKSARGDSGVALNSAVSAATGCLTIIDLNLISCNSDEWKEHTRVKVNTLRVKCKELSSKMRIRSERLQNESDQKNSFDLEVIDLCTRKLTSSKPSYSDIENIVTQFQRLIWKHRNIIWKNAIPSSPIDMLSPESALKILGYKLNRQTTLGQHKMNGALFEVAGLIDNQNNEVFISEQFPLDTQNFTIAHELGHALLHKQSGLHRDRALDRAGVNDGRNIQELQADKFASYFLVPQKLTRHIFKQIFLTEKFVLQEDTAFALNVNNVNELKENCKNLRGLSRILASTESYNGKSFKSIAKQFGVSIEAMAIRLEELELLEF